MPSLLLVDDQQTVLQTYQRLLSRKIPGARVQVAASAAGGLEVVRGGAVDLVVADFRMPGTNGLEFLGEVREASPRTRRVLFTAYREDEELRTALVGGAAEACISKDADPAELLRCIQALLPGDAAARAG